MGQSSLRHVQMALGLARPWPIWGSNRPSQEPSWASPWASPDGLSSLTGFKSRPFQPRTCPGGVPYGVWALGPGPLDLGVGPCGPTPDTPWAHMDPGMGHPIQRARA